MNYIYNNPTHCILALVMTVISTLNMDYQKIDINHLIKKQKHFFVVVVGHAICKREIKVYMHHRGSANDDPS